MDSRSVSPLLAVSDIDNSMAFCARLGLEPTTVSETYAKLSNEQGGVLHLAVGGDPSPDRPDVAIRVPESGSEVGHVVVIEVADCEKACADLESAGVTLLGRLASPFPGEVRAFLRDPDGHLIELNQPLVT